MRRRKDWFLGLTLVTSLAPRVFAGEAEDDFASRCAAPGVVRCVGFDTMAATKGPADYVNDPAAYGLLEEGSVPPVIDAVDRASGGGSLKFTIPSNSGSSFGSYWTNFSDDLSVQFGVGDDFYVQWRQRFSKEMLETEYMEDYAGGVTQGGWKQIIIGEGDRPGTNIHSCTDLEIVVVDGWQRGFPQMYHSCGAKDGQYEGLSEPLPPYDFLLQNAIRNPPCSYKSPTIPPCEGYVADQWMTFQVHVRVGTPYTNDHVYKHDSVIQLWVAKEGQASKLVLDFSPKDPACQAEQESVPACQTGYDLFNDDPSVRKYGQVWLLPYMTAKDPAQPHPEAYTWYDELVISTQPIADPMGAPPPGSDAGSSTGGGGSGGAAPDGGAGSGGVAASGGAHTGGASAGGGSSGSAAKTNDSGDDAGCSVHSSAPKSDALPWLALAAVGIGALRRKRRHAALSHGQ